jgi:hypothetical protein
MSIVLLRLLLCGCQKRDQNVNRDTYRMVYQYVPLRSAISVRLALSLSAWDICGK